MTQCILCGADLYYSVELKKYSCANCEIEWTIEEHKKTTNWAVRHIRDLENENITLKTRISNLESLCIQLNSRITNLEG